MLALQPALPGQPGLNRVVRREHAALLAWLALGLAGYLLLPWYLLQSGDLIDALPGLWAGPHTANGLAQATAHGRP